MFEVGNIDIELDESDDLDLTMIPGSDIEKDPFVTVKAGSEACWVFVKVTESDNFDDFMTYGMGSDWTAVPGNEGYYYTEVESLVDADADKVLTVLAGDKVTVLGNVTKGQMDAIKAGTEAKPTLSFIAAAVQKENVATVADAWAKLPTEFIPTN